MGVRGEEPIHALRQRFRGGVNPASLCTVRAARGRGVLPLTPAPLPFEGRGEPDADSG
jgi:hypothetical protein